MTNTYRGEISAVLGGAERVLRLTLGGLAELEEAFGAEDLTDLARRFSNGTLKASDAVRVIGAGLRGAGEAVSNTDVSGMHVEGGVAGYVDIVVRLIAATFGLDEAKAGDGPLGRRGGQDTRAFPWDDVIGFGLGVLRLPPDAFWAMTPRELARAIDAVRPRGVPPMDRRALDALMARHPDRREFNDHQF